MSNAIRRVSLVVAVAFTPAAFAEDAPSPSVLYDNFQACLRIAASKLDDQRSDAMTIARAIQGLCPGQWFAIFPPPNMSTTSMEARERFEEQAKQMRTDTALQVVLRTRVEKMNAKK